MICWNCKKEIEQKDAYCRYCGKGQGDNIPWYYTWLGIWILFFFIGPVNLWLLYRSPVITKKWKYINAVIILSLSVWFGYVMYKGLANIFEIYSSFLTMY